MNLTRKARMVAEGNLAKPDSDVPVYASGFHVNRSKSYLPFDMSMDDLPDDCDNEYQCERFYPDAHEIDEKPPKMPVPLGPPIRINCFVDADHPGDQVTRRSYIGIILMIYKAWVISFSKRKYS